MRFNAHLLYRAQAWQHLHRAHDDWRSVGVGVRRKGRAVSPVVRLQRDCRGRRTDTLESHASRRATQCGRTLLLSRCPRISKRKSDFSREPAWY